MKFHDSFLQRIDTDAKRKVVGFLLKNDTAMSEREISALAGVSHMTVNRVLRDLEQCNLVFYERVGRAHVWKINQQSYIYNILKDFYQRIKQIPCPLDALKAEILSCLPKKNLIKVVLFGSISRQQEKADSDIDVFILTADKKSAAALEIPLDKLSLQCLGKFGNRLAPYVLTEGQFRQKKNLKLMKEIEDGIQLFPVRR